MLLDELNNKTVTQIELAIKLDNFDYEKNETMYFEKMACYGLLDSHVHYIKQYVDILEHKDSGKRALFDELQFNFVEFKTNALGNSIPQIEYTYKDALGQLDATYTLFRDKINAAGVDFDRVTEVHCFITVSNHFPRQSAIEQNIVKEAADSVNHLDLSFEPEIQIS